MASISFTQKIKHVTDLFFNVTPVWTWQVWLVDKKKKTQTWVIIRLFYFYIFDTEYKQNCYYACDKDPFVWFSSLTAFQESLQKGWAHLKDNWYQHRKAKFFCERLIYVFKGHTCTHVFSLRLGPIHWRCLERRKETTRREMKGRNVFWRDRRRLFLWSFMLSFVHHFRSNVLDAEVWIPPH